MSQSSRPSQILLFSQPRTACHLLERMLTAKQSDLRFCLNPFAAARPNQAASLTEESVANGIPDDLRTAFAKEVHDGVTVWQKALAETQGAGDTLFFHSHPQFALDPEKALSYVRSDWKTPATHAKPDNYTLIPESPLLHAGTVPLLTFRHPASTAAAVYKAMAQIEQTSNLSNYLVARNLGWARELYDWYIMHGITPVLAEAEDYISSPNFVKGLAEKVGLDPTTCTFTWEKATEDDIQKMHPMYVRLQQTLLGSTGIVGQRVRRIGSIDEEAVKWRDEFGAEAATLIEAAASAAMPDYNYLSKRKFSLTS